MKNRTQQSESRSEKTKGRKLLPALCRLAGTAILLLVIITAIPVAMPRFFGYEAYVVITGSMEPEIPVGSLTYVKAIPPDEVEDDDVIAFKTDVESVVIHRVVRNHVVEGTFTTKGDANDEEDPEDVIYANYLGKVEKHYPVMGEMLAIYMTNIGKVFVLCFAACGVILNMLAGRLKQDKKKKKTTKSKNPEKVTVDLSDGDSPTAGSAEAEPEE